ncbi:MAG: hypothetical protein Nk1A_8160 [Endomicrobiia bacterium]|nr:MAG: hypothetical protein Nk1A_8160 [Endomicrobiia bacterium]
MEETQEAGDVNRDELDPANIGDNIIGNASFLDISRILSRNQAENAEMLLPLMTLL